MLPLLLAHCCYRDQLYFDRVHPLAPIIHQGRYLSWARQNDKSRPRVCLQFAMWTLAASASAQFHNMRESLHACGRSNLEALDHNEQFVSDAALEAAQAWLLITHYELRYMQYQRAWITAGRAFRIVQISKLHQIDAINSTDMSLESEVWVECEEKRRTFWLAYCLDRFINFRNRGPLTLQEEVVSELSSTTRTLKLPLRFALVSRLPSQIFNTADRSSWNSCP